MEELMRALREEALALGAFRAELVKVEDISTDASFRSLCASNACGNYGKNYMCPPDIGTIEELMQELRAARAQGEIRPDDLANVAQQLAPFLSPEQQRRLSQVMNQLK